MLMPEGALTRATPDPAAAADIAKGREVLRALGPFDIGQAVVVIDGHVVAVEDIEGTDGLLARVARLRGAGPYPRQGRPRRAGEGAQERPGSALRPADRRVRETVEGVASAGLAGIAVIAGHTIAAESQDMIAAADRAGLFIQGLPA